MSVRFGLNLTTLIAAAVVVVFSMALAPAAAGWVAFGVSTGIATVAIIGLMVTRTWGDRVGQASIATVSLWSLVAALVFSGNVLTWLVFGDAIAIASLSLVQLVVNEVNSHRALGASVTAGVSQGGGRVNLAA